MGSCLRLERSERMESWSSEKPEEGDRSWGLVGGMGDTQVYKHAHSWAGCKMGSRQENYLG